MVQMVFGCVPDRGVFKDADGFTYIKRLPFLESGYNCIRVKELDPRPNEDGEIMYFPFTYPVSMLSSDEVGFPQLPAEITAGE